MDSRRHERRSVSVFEKVFVGMALCLTLTASCWAQTVNATLSGSVTDPSGAIIPDAQITATNVATGVTWKTVSDSSGNYIFQSLPPGTYSFRFEKSGFKATILSNITLQVDQKASMNAQLQVGSVAQTVEVRSAAPLVNTTTASVGTVINNEHVVDLPLNLRQYGSLATLVPGTVTDNGGFASSSIGSPFSGTSFNANGNRSSSNNYLIDGIMSRNLSFGGFALQPPPDAVQEFNLQTNIYNAAFGLTAGSTINLATKSGTNDIHGSVYEFLRNSGIDARNFFAASVPEFRRNQFGFAVGGPIKKDKAFWFVNYEGLREISGNSLGSTIPTSQELQGNLSGALTGKTTNLCGAGGPANLNFDSGQLFNPATVQSFTCPAGSASAGSSILVGQPIPGNIITNIDPVAQKALSFNPFPAPNRVGLPNFVNQQPYTENDNTFIIRGDDNVSNDDKLFARYMFGQSNQFNPGSGYSSLPGFGDTLYYRGQNVALGWTHIFGPTLLSEARFGFQRDYDIENCASCPRSPNFMSGFGIKNLTGYSAATQGFPIFSFNNFSTIGDSEYRPVISPDMVETYHDNITWTRGAHTFVFGADLEFWQVLGEAAAFSPHGQLAFNGQFSGLAGEMTGATGVSDLADFLLGYPQTANRTLEYLGTNQVGGKFWSFYAQDNFKVKPNLSLNLGIRWEYRGFPVDKRNNFATFVPTGPPFSGPGNGLLVTAEPNALNDSYCTNPAYSYVISSTGQCLVATSAERAKLGFTGRTRQTLVFPYYGDYDPRFGFAWTPTKSDKLILRGGYGIFTDLPNFNNMHFVNNNPINGASQIYNTAFGSPVPLTNSVPTTSANVFAGAAGIPLLSQQYASLYVTPNYKDPVIQEWSFGIQSQLARNWALETDYIGNRGYWLGTLHLFANQALPGIGPIQPRRPYPDFNQMLFTSADAQSIYDSLQVKLTKRFSNGFTFLASYTWQNAFDNNEGDEGFGGGVGNVNAQNDNCLMCNWGPAYDDAHHRFVISGVWQLPVGQGMHFLNHGGVVNQVAGGWRFSGIYSFQTGFPFTALSPTDFSNSGSSNPFPDRVCNGNNGPQTVAQWFNTKCFTTTFLGQALASGSPRFGNEQRNVLFGPPLNDLDFALLKDWQLSERSKLEFRAETYNSLNTPPFGFPSATVGSPTYGQILSAGAAREIQFALKLLF